MEAWTVRNSVDLPDLLTYDQPVDLCDLAKWRTWSQTSNARKRSRTWVIVDTLSRTSIGHSDSDNADMACYSDSLLRISRACGDQAT